MNEPVIDRWARWFLTRRHAGDPALLAKTLDRLAPIRDRVLDNAAVGEGETVLDVGCGDGLIGFGALGRVGDTGHVIFSDLSSDLVERSRAVAIELGVEDRCPFMRAPAEDLAVIASDSVDVVTTRSVLAYVGQKQRAFHEFFRVLKSNGRFSVYEPINRHIVEEPPGQFDGFDVTEVSDLAERVASVFTARQPVETDPMFNFDERDLLRFAADAGFTERHLEFRLSTARREAMPWATYSDAASNPIAPSLTEAISETLTGDEAAQFIACLRPQVETGVGTSVTAVAYVWGARP